MLESRGYKDLTLPGKQPLPQHILVSDFLVPVLQMRMWLIGKAPAWHTQGPGFNTQHWNEGGRESWQAGYYVKTVPDFFFY